MKASSIPMSEVHRILTIRRPVASSLLSFGDGHLEGRSRGVRGVVKELPVPVALGWCSQGRFLQPLRHRHAGVGHPRRLHWRRHVLCRCATSRSGGSTLLVKTLLSRCLSLCAKLPHLNPPLPLSLALSNFISSEHTHLLLSRSAPCLQGPCRSPATRACCGPSAGTAPCRAAASGTRSAAIDVVRLWRCSYLAVVAPQAAGHRMLHV